MMVYPRSSLYMPYGAYELKARYQTNLMLAMLIVITSVALVLTGAWVSSLFGEDAPPVVIKDPIKVKPWDVNLQETLIQRQDVQTTDAATVRARVGIPEPRPDNEVIDEDVVIVSRSEMADILDSGRPGIIGEGEQRGIIIETEITPDIPDPNQYYVVDREPAFIYEHVPPYPRLLQQAGITGTVVVRALVDEEGNVIDAIVQKSSDTGGLDEAAIEAAYKNKFSPALRGGQPVKHWVSYSVVFRLD